MADDPYTRIYWRLSDEYSDVFDDGPLLGAYLQLLVQADMSWPAKPVVPGTVEPEAYASLVEIGLAIEVGKRYTIKGLDKERRRRQRAGRKGARARWDKARQEDDDEGPEGPATPAPETPPKGPSPTPRNATAPANGHATAPANADHRSDATRNANAYANGMPSRAEKSKDKKRRDKKREGRLDPLGSESARGNLSPVDARRSDGDEEREAAIARARAKLADPDTSPDLRQAAIAQLNQLGVPPTPDELDFGAEPA